MQVQVQVPETLLTGEEFISQTEFRERYELVNGRMVRRRMPDAITSVMRSGSL